MKASLNSESVAFLIVKVSWHKIRETKHLDEPLKMLHAEKKLYGNTELRWPASLELVN